MSEARVQDMRTNNDLIISGYEGESRCPIQTPLWLCTAF
jgi:hypothetical protein